LKLYTDKIFVSIEGDDDNNLGTSNTTAIRTIKNALAIANPMKDTLNSNGMHEEILTTITVRPGTYSESKVFITAEYLSIQGNTTQNTILTNILI
jgi:hypothetical protein